LFGFILTFIAARTVMLPIMSHRMPNLYFFPRGTHVHHLSYGIFLLTGVVLYGTSLQIGKVESAPGGEPKGVPRDCAGRRSRHSGTLIPR
jgi:hypothetical protein